MILNLLILIFPSQDQVKTIEKFDLGLELVCLCGMHFKVVEEMIKW